MELEDLWADARKQAAQNAIVLRCVNHLTGYECFIEIPRTEKNIAAAADLYDGATATTASPQPFVSETNVVLADDHAGPPA